MSKRTNQTAKAVMQLAHSIKDQFATFSEALKAAWAEIKMQANTVEKTFRFNNGSSKTIKVLAVLPTLTGSEKQVSWANKIRENFLNLAYANVRSTFTDVAWSKFESSIIALQSQTSASWYINNRDVTVGSLLRDLVA